MVKRYRLFGLLTLVAAGAVAIAAADESAQKPAARPQVEVVFCLDTTGSMGGLIDAAKQKIWAICNQIAGGRPTPNLKVGLVAYRDRGDPYVTKVFDLTEDLDAIHGHLMQFKAEGGGDFPESVNQALHESVTKIKWSHNKKTLKMIFLVGDAPPHMNYTDDVKYTDSCKLAAGKDIIINTVQCGTHAETQKYWQDICRLAEGSYVQIDAKGGPVVVYTTPFDADLAKINSDLAGSTVVFGDARRQSDGKEKAKKVAALPAPAAADRASFFGRSGGSKGAAGDYDLLDQIKNKTVKLEELAKEQLPPELQNLNLEQKKAYLEKLDKKRTELNQQAAELAKKRGEFIAKKQAEEQKKGARDSFDNQVLQILQRQATRVNIHYDVEEKKK